MRNLIGWCLLLAAAGASSPPRQLATRFRGALVYLELTAPNGVRFELYTDTGGGMYLSLAAATRLGLPVSPDSELAAHFGAGSGTTHFPALSAASAIPLPSGNDSVAVFARTAQIPGWPEVADGLLGQSWFGGHVWTWNYPQQTLTIDEASWTPSPGDHVVPLGFRRDSTGARATNFPRIEVVIDGQKIPMLLDTGAETFLSDSARRVIGDTLPALRATSMIGATIFERWHRAHPGWRTIGHAQVGTGSGMIEVPSVEIAGLRVGPVWFTSRPDRNFEQYMSSMMDAQVEGSLGGNALSTLRMTIDYPGARAAFSLPARWAPAGISSPLFESHAAFDPRTGDLLFVRSSKDFSGWHLLLSHCGASGWTTPSAPAFAAAGLEADPFYTPDGKALYFISTRATGSMRSRDLDIWRIERGVDGRWGKPERLPEPVNSAGAEWFPRPAADGWLYFGSDRPGGLGNTDIWRARQGGDGAWTVENLGPNINTAGNEYEPLPSPDGRTMIVEASDSMFESIHSSAGWSPRTALGAEMNENGTEIGALFSPSGKSVLFSRDTKGDESGEFFVWHRAGNEEWPPACPARGSHGD